MNKFSLQPDDHMRWIYNSYHPDYHSDYAKNLRDARANALRQCPKWMLEEAYLNDQSIKRKSRKYPA